MLQANLMKLRECWQMEIMDLPEEFSLFYMSTPDQVITVFKNFTFFKFQINHKYISLKKIHQCFTAL